MFEHPLKASFEIAAKLAVMDGTDDGMYNGLPIEVCIVVKVQSCCQELC